MTNVRCVLLLSFLLGSQASAQTPRDFAVDLSAVVSEPPCITLSWSITKTGKHQRPERFTVGKAKPHGLSKRIFCNQTSYVDYTAYYGSRIQYWMERTYTGIYPTTAMGYLSAGVNVPMTSIAEELLLVIDDTIACAARAGDRAVEKRLSARDGRSKR